MTTSSSISNILLALAGVIAVFFLVHVTLWLQSGTTGVSIGFFEILGMRLRGINPQPILTAKIGAKQAGVDVDTRDLEIHAVEGGNVTAVVRAMIEAKQENRSLDFATAAARERSNRLEQESKA